MRRFVISFFDRFLDLIFDTAQQVRLGMHILNRVRGDNDYDPRSNGEYWALQEIKRQFQGKDIVILDVGANVGDWTRQAAAGLSPGSVVYGIEPVRATFERYQEAAAASPSAAKIRPIHAALSDRDGEGTIFVDGDLNTTNSLHEHRLTERQGGPSPRNGKQETTLLMRGDALCRREGIERIHFLKIDVEGHEVSVLLGFEEMLSRKAIDYIQFEYVHCWIDAGHFLREPFELLLKKGYVLGKLAGDRILFIDAYDKSLEKFEYANYFAVRSPELAALWPSRRISR
jgi:FkbM family methyltransferase